MGQVCEETGRTGVAVALAALLTVAPAVPITHERPGPGGGTARAVRALVPNGEGELLATRHGLAAAGGEASRSRGGCQDAGVVRREPGAGRPPGRLLQPGPGHERVLHGFRRDLRALRASACDTPRRPQAAHRARVARRRAAAGLDAEGRVPGGAGGSLARGRGPGHRSRELLPGVGGGALEDGPRHLRTGHVPRAVAGDRPRVHGGEGRRAEVHLRGASGGGPDPDPGPLRRCERGAADAGRAARGADPDRRPGGGPSVRLPGAGRDAGEGGSGLRGARGQGCRERSRRLPDRPLRPHPPPLRRPRRPALLRLHRRRERRRDRRHRRRRCGQRLRGGRDELGGGNPPGGLPRHRRRLGHAGRHREL